VRGFSESTGSTGGSTESDVTGVRQWRQSPLLQRLAGEEMATKPEHGSEGGHLIAGGAGGVMWRRRDAGACWRYVPLASGLGTG
jgi:hypothetical protein